MSKQPHPSSAEEHEARLAAIIREILCDRDRPVHGGDRIIDDLGMDSDDASFLLIPEVERQFEFRADRSEWADAFTVADVVALIVRHVQGCDRGGRSE